MATSFLWQSFPLGPLWRSALHERDGWLRWTHLYDPSHQSYLSHFARRLSEDHSRQKGGNQLFHLTDDQGLYEESGTFEPPPNCPGAAPYFDVPRHPPVNHFCASCLSLLMTNQAVSVVLLAGG